VKGVLERAFFAPAGPRLLRATRVVLAAQALWIMLSRPDLPELAAWPQVFWTGAEPGIQARFAYASLGVTFAWVRFVALIAALLATLVGLWPRVSALVAACLLYQIAPLEEILAGIPHTSFGGLTTPTIGLFLLGFAEEPAKDAPASPEWRWPVATTRLFFAFGYLLPLLAKLRFAGPAWFTADNVRAWIMVNEPLTRAPWGPVIAASDALCWAVALGTLALELLFPLAVFSRRAAWVLVPLAAAFHVGTALTLGYFFPSLPLLLLFVDWDVSRGPRPGVPVAAEAGAVPR
jgi:hypothetical protein